MRYVLESGATSGIGYNATLDLAERGFSVFAAGRGAELGHQLAAKAQRGELLPHGIAVTVIRPGLIQTDFADAEIQHIKAPRKLECPYEAALADFEDAFTRAHGAARPTHMLSRDIRKAITADNPAAEVVLGTDIKTAC